MVQTGAARWRPPPASQASSSRESTPERGTATPFEGDGKDEDDWSYEGKSMTLRDILVRAGDATFAHFDILREPYLSFHHSFFRIYTGLAPKGGAYPSPERKKTTKVWLICAYSATPRWQGC